MYICYGYQDRPSYSSNHSSESPKLLSRNNSARPEICLKRSNSFLSMPVLRMIQLSDILLSQQSKAKMHFFLLLLKRY